MERPEPVMREKQPNSKYCFVCGIENDYGLKMDFYSLGEGIVETVYTVPERYQGYPGVVHGGIVASMLDEVVGRAAMAGDPNHFRVTAKLEIRYRRPVPIGEPLILRGVMERRAGRRAKAHAELRLPDATLAAEADATLVDLPSEAVDAEELARLGWRVYPDGPPDSDSGE